MSDIFKANFGSSNYKKKKAEYTVSTKFTFLYADMRKAKEYAVKGEYFRNTGSMHISK